MEVVIIYVSFRGMVTTLVAARTDTRLELMDAHAIIHQVRSQEVKIFNQDVLVLFSWVYNLRIYEI